MATKKSSSPIRFWVRRLAEADERLAEAEQRVQQLTLKRDSLKAKMNEAFNETYDIE